MKQCLITFRSITPAQRGEGVLIKNGIPCSLQRTPRWMQEQGCGYSLKLPFKDVYQAARMLGENEIAYRKIYLQKDSGKWEELTL